MQLEISTITTRIHPDRISPSELEGMADTDLDRNYATLWKEVQAGLEWTARRLELVAQYRAEYRRRGRPLPKLAGRLDQWLEAIAAGRLAAEVYRRFASRTMVLNTLMRLPLSEQRALAKGRTIKVVTGGPKDSINTKDLPIERLTRDELTQVFSVTGIRDPEEQIQHIEDLRRIDMSPVLREVTVFFTAAEYQKLVVLAKEAHCRVTTYVKQKALAGVQ